MKKWTVDIDCWEPGEVRYGKFVPFEIEEPKMDEDTVVRSYLIAGFGALALALVIATVLALQGCAPKGYVKASEIAPLVSTITARHDMYVKGDSVLGVRKAERYLRSSRLLRQVVGEARTAGGE